MPFPAWNPPLLFWLVQAAVGSSFFIAVLGRDGVDRRFFAAHSLLLASLWLALSGATGLTGNYLFVLCILCLIAAWRFQSGNVSSGKNWLLLAAALGGLWGLLQMASIPDGFSIWLRLWMLLSVYIGAFTLGIIYLGLALVFAPVGWIEDPGYACHKAAFPIEKMLYYRALYQIGSLVAIPMIADREGPRFLALIVHRPGLLAMTWITGWLLPLMLLIHDESVEPRSPAEQQWRFLILSLSCGFSVLIGARIFL